MSQTVTYQLYDTLNIRVQNGSNGNVGIGTTMPQGFFHVNSGDINFTNNTMYTTSISSPLTYINFNGKILCNCIIPNIGTCNVSVDQITSLGDSDTISFGGCNVSNINDLKANNFIGSNIWVNNVYASNSINCFGPINAFGQTITSSNYVGDVNAVNIYGTLRSPNQSNITSLGTLISLAVTGNVTASTFIGDLQATNIYGTLQSANQSNITNVGTLGTLSVSNSATVTGNLSANNINTNQISGILTNPNQSNITNLGTLTSLSVSGNVSANYFIGNVNATNISGTLTTAAQTNITSVGILSSLFVNGTTISCNIQSTNITGTLQTSEQLNITRLGTLTSLTVTGGIESTTGNISSSTGTISAYSDITSTNGNVTGNYLFGIIATSNQPNITTVGTLTDLNVSGNITGNFIGTISTNNLELSNLTANNITANNIYGTLQSPNQSNITNLGTLNSLTVTNNITSTNGNISASAGTISAYGTITSTNGDITSTNGNISGQYINGTLSTTAQNNITNVGNLTSLTVTGNIESTTGSITATTGTISSYGDLSSTNGNISAPTGTITSYGNLSTTNGNISAPSGNISSLCNITSTGGNVSGNYLFGIIGTSNQPNITTIGTLATLNVTGNVSAGAFNGPIYGDIYGTIHTSNQPNITSLGTLTGLYVNGTINTNTLQATTLTGLLTTANQSNITTIGELGSLNVMGNIYGSNNITGSNITANYLTGTLQTSSQPNITTVGTLGSLTVTSNISSYSLTTGKIFASNNTIDFGGAIFSNCFVPFLGSCNVISSNVGTIQITTNNIDTQTLSTCNILSTGTTIACNLIAPNITVDTIKSFSSSTISFGSCNVSNINNLNANNFIGSNIWVNNVYSSNSIYSFGPINANGQTVTASNFVGDVNAQNISGILQSPNQSNITNVGTLGSLSVTNSITSSSLSSTNISGSNVNVSNVSTTTLSATSANIQYLSTDSISGYSGCNISFNNNSINNIDSINAKTITASNINVIGTLTTMNQTEIHTNSNLYINNLLSGIGPAAVISQASTDPSYVPNTSALSNANAIAAFYSADASTMIPVLIVGSNNNPPTGGGYVGINTINANYNLSVHGTIGLSGPSAYNTTINRIFYIASSNYNGIASDPVTNNMNFIIQWSGSNGEIINNKYAFKTSIGFHVATANNDIAYRLFETIITPSLTPVSYVTATSMDTIGSVIYNIKHTVSRYQENNNAILINVNWTTANTDDSSYEQNAYADVTILADDSLGVFSFA